MDRLIRFLEAISGGSGVVAAWLVIPLIFATSYEVFSRYVLGAPTIWAFELGYMATGTHFLIGAAYTLREGGHIRIDIVYDHLGPRAQAWINVFGYLLLMLPASWLITYGLWDYAAAAIESGERSGQSAWNPVIWPFRVVLLCGFVLLSLQGTVELLKAIRATVRYARSDGGGDTGA